MKPSLRLRRTLTSVYEQLWGRSHNNTHLSISVRIRHVGRLIVATWRRTRTRRWCRPHCETLGSFALRRHTLVSRWIGSQSKTRPNLVSASASSLVNPLASCRHHAGGALFTSSRREMSPSALRVAISCRRGAASLVHAYGSWHLPGRKKARKRGSRRDITLKPATQWPVGRGPAARALRRV